MAALHPQHFVDRCPWFVTCVLKYFTGDIFKCILLKSIFTQIPLNFISEDPIDNKSALVQVMAWHQIGVKPLPEPMMTQFTDVYMHHQANDPITYYRYYRVVDQASVN